MGHPVFRWDGMLQIRLNIARLPAIPVPTWAWGTCRRPSPSAPGAPPPTRSTPPEGQRGSASCETSPAHANNPLSQSSVDGKFKKIVNKTPWQDFIKYTGDRLLRVTRSKPWTCTNRSLFYTSLVPTENVYKPKNVLSEHVLSDLQGTKLSWACEVPSVLLAIKHDMFVMLQVIE